MLTRQPPRISLVSASVPTRNKRRSIAGLVRAIHSAYLEWRIQGITKDIALLEYDVQEIPEVIKLYRRAQADLLIKKASIARLDFSC